MEIQNMTNLEFNSIVEKMKTIKDDTGEHLQMDSLIISDNKSYNKHLFNPKDELHELRSLSKSVLSMCVGILMYDYKIKDQASKSKYCID